MGNGGKCSKKACRCWGHRRGKPQRAGRQVGVGEEPNVLEEMVSGGGQVPPSNGVGREMEVVGVIKYKPETGEWEEEMQAKQAGLSLGGTAREELGVVNKGINSGNKWEPVPSSPGNDRRGGEGA